MVMILPFPTPAANSQRPLAPPHFVRAKALIEAGGMAQAAALDLTADGVALLEGDRPTAVDNTINGQAMSWLVEALETLILANGAQAADRGLLAAVDAWRGQNRS